MNRSPDPVRRGCHHGWAHRRCKPGHRTGRRCRPTPRRKKPRHKKARHQKAQRRRANVIAFAVAKAVASKRPRHVRDGVGQVLFAARHAAALLSSIGQSSRTTVSSRVLFLWGDSVVCSGRDPHRRATSRPRWFRGSNLEPILKSRSTVSTPSVEGPAMLLPAAFSIGSLNHRSPISFRSGLGPSTRPECFSAAEQARSWVLRVVPRQTDRALLGATSRHSARSSVL